MDLHDASSSVASSVSCKTLSGSSGRKLTNQLQKKSSFVLAPSQSSHDESLKVCLKRHQSVPCDYVSEFNSLSLNDNRCNVRSRLSRLNSDTESNSSFPYFDCDSESLVSFDAYSAYSPSDACNSVDDSASDISYHSSIHRPLKRRKFTDFSNEVDSQHSFDHETEEEICSEPITNIPSQTEYGEVYLKKREINYESLTVFIFFLLLLIIGGVLLLIIVSVCEAQNKRVIPLNNVEENLSHCLIGHEFTKSVIMDGFRKFSDSHVEDKVHFMWWVGSVGIGKSYAKQLIKTSIGSTVNVFSIVSSLLRKETNAIENEVQNLVQILDICKPNFIFIDGFDAENDIVLRYLRIFFERLKLNRERDFHHIRMKVLIVVIGIQGSHYITESYEEHVARPHETRDSFAYNKLQQKLQAISPFKNIDFTLHLITVPFLPLEVHHIEKCIIQQLNFLSKSKCASESDKQLEEFVKARNFTVREVQEKVLKLFNVQAKNSGMVVSFGCKRIYRVVSSLLFRIPNEEFDIS